MTGYKSDSTGGGSAQPEILVESGSLLEVVSQAMRLRIDPDSSQVGDLTGNYPGIGPNGGLFAHRNQDFPVPNGRIRPAQQWWDPIAQASTTIGGSLRPYSFQAFGGPIPDTQTEIILKGQASAENSLTNPAGNCLDLLAIFGLEHNHNQFFHYFIEDQVEVTVELGYFLGGAPENTGASFTPSGKHITLRPAPTGSVHMGTVADWNAYFASGGVLPRTAGFEGFQHDATFQHFMLVRIPPGGSFFPHPAWRITRTGTTTFPVLMINDFLAATWNAPIGFMQ